MCRNVPELELPQRCRHAKAVVGDCHPQQPSEVATPQAPLQPKMVEYLSTHTASDPPDLVEAKDLELIRLRNAAEDDLEQAEHMSHNLWSNAGAGQAPISPLDGYQALKAENTGRPKPLGLPLALWPCWEEAASAYLLWERAALARVDAVIDLQSVRSRMKDQLQPSEPCSPSQAVETDTVDETCEELTVEDMRQELEFQVYDYIDADAHADEMRKQSVEAIQILKLLTEPESIIRPLFDATDRVLASMHALQVVGYQHGMPEWDFAQEQLQRLEQEKAQYILSVAHLFTQTKAESFWQSAWSIVAEFKQFEVWSIVAEAKQVDVEQSMDNVLEELMCG